MKKKIAQALTVVFLILAMLATTLPGLASGGQVRGEKAQGSAYQVQVQDPPPFQP